MTSLILMIAFILVGITMLTVVVLGVLFFMTKDTPVPHTPEEDVEQMKYISEWFKKHKK